jgi:dUTP pyrophosphatase
MSKFNVVCLNENAMLPVRATFGAAGYDLYSDSDGVVPAHSRVLVGTSISIHIPRGYCGQIWSRSGFSVKSGIETGAGIIDSDYRGELKVLLYNHTNTNFKYAKNTRIAQILLVPVHLPDVHEVSVLSETNRGAGGFGSSGTGSI